MWTPDFPWGAKPDYVESDLASLERWGTNAYGQAWADAEATGGRLEEEQVPIMGLLSRHTVTPDVARELFRIWYETDVRGVLPAVRVPTMLLVRDRYPVEESRSPSTSHR